VDDEELFRHLRRDHYFCHFCDADGVQAYYPDYGMLKDHFKNTHYLCEEGSCIDEQFTHAFRTELDLKAHKLERHKLSKAESKLNRQVEVDLSFNRRQPRGSREVHTPVTTEDRVPDMTEDFPSLDGRSKPSSAQANKATGNMANRLASSSGRNWASVNHHSAAFREADFPSLPGTSASQTVAPSVSTKIKKKATDETSRVQPIMDFPSLPSYSQNQVHAFGPQYRNPTGYTPAWSSQERQPEKGGKKVAPAPDLDFPSLQPSSNPGRPEKKAKSVKKAVVPKPEPILNSSSSLRSAADLIFSGSAASSSNGHSTKAYEATSEKENVPKINVVEQLPKQSKPPPGFGRPVVSSSKNKIIVPSKRYLQPRDFNERNAKLMTSIVKAFGGGKSLEFARFKDLSHQYKEDKIDSSAYLTHCNAILESTSKLDSFVADLIVLLPQIDKQQQLSKAFKAKFPESKALSELMSCDYCHQVMKRSDSKMHNDLHGIDEEFPAL